MRLGEVLNKIFRKKGANELVNRKLTKNIYEATEHQAQDEKQFEEVRESIIAEQSQIDKSQEELQQMRKKYIILGVGIMTGIIVIALLSVIYTRINNSNFKEENINILINGPEFIKVGEKVEYEIIIENKNRINLEDVVISMNIPDNFILDKESFITNKNLSGIKINVGDIKKRSKKIYKIKSKINYSSSSDLLYKVSIKYKPKNVDSYFQKQYFKKIYLEQSNIDVAIFSAETVSNGELIELKLILKNNGKDVYENINLKVDYPEGFVFEKSSIKANDDYNTQWKFKDFSGESQQEIKILGRLMGDIHSMKKFKVQVNKNKGDENFLFEAEKSIKIIPRKIILRQEVNNKKAYAGEELKYVISAKNNSTVSLRNLILKVHLPEKYIQPQKVIVNKGYYNSRENIIIWKASDVKKLNKLQSGEEVEVTFSLMLQRNISEKNKNPYVRIYSEIESLDIDSPLFENKKVISQKLKTLIHSECNIVSIVKYLAEDNDGKELKSLQVNKKTNLRITIALNNTTNDLKNAKFFAVLPSGINWERQIFPEGNNLEFDKRTNKLEWNIGFIKAGTGFTLPVKKAEFIVSVIPSSNQIGKVVKIIDGMEIIAKDTFTKNNVKYRLNSMKSDMIEGIINGVVEDVE